MVNTTAFDVAEYLNTPEDISEYLNEAIEDGDAGLIQDALGNIARSHGLSNVAKDAGLSRSSLYKVLTVDASPTFRTVNSVAHALGLKVALIPADQHSPLPHLSPTTKQQQFM